MQSGCPEFLLKFVDCNYYFSFVSEDKIYDQISKICDAQGVVGLPLGSGTCRFASTSSGLFFGGGVRGPAGGRLNSHDVIRLSWGLEFRNHVVGFRSGYL